MNKENKFYQRLYIWVVVIMLGGCNTSYIKNIDSFPSFQEKNVIQLAKNQFIVCSALMTHVSLIDTEARLHCIQYNLVPKLLYKKYFYECSLTNPVSYIFVCE